MVPDLGVHAVGEVDGRRIHGQGNRLPLWCEREDLVLFEIGLQVLEELQWIGDLVLPIDDSVQPIDVGRSRTVFVGPMGGHSPLCTTMHVMGTNLHLDRLATRTDHRRVQ